MPSKSSESNFNRLRRETEGDTPPPGLFQHPLCGWGFNGGRITPHAPGRAGERLSLMYQTRKVNYTHDACIDAIIANPAISQGELAQMFGYSQGWISILINSDVFKERLAARKAELTDPFITAQFDEKIKGAAGRALDKLLDRLDNPGMTVATKDLIAIARLGGTPAPAQNVSVQNNYVMNMPPQAPNSKSWLENRMGGKSAEGGHPRLSVPNVAAVNPLLDSDAPVAFLPLVEELR